jgi:hypothetical protein
MPQFTYRHPHADIAFEWDGGTQIKIHTSASYGTGGTCPGWGVVPDRVDIREADLWQSDLLPENERPEFPTGGSVVMLDHTQEAFEAACNAWWNGEHIKTSRDFRAHPMVIKGGSGMFVCTLDYRYTGGDVIEASPAGLGDWRPIVDLADDNMTPDQVTTEWLYGRLNGWQIGFMQLHGVLGERPDDPARYDDGAHDAHLAWVHRWFPGEVAKDCSAGVWRAWLAGRLADGFRRGETEQWRNAGIPVQHIAKWSPWTAQRATADGRRWNFVWCGYPYAFVYSPDTDRPTGNTVEACRWILRPQERDLGGMTVRAWLDAQADAFVARIDADTRATITATPDEIEDGDTIVNASVTGRTVVRHEDSKTGRTVFYADATGRELTVGDFLHWDREIPIKRNVVICTTPATT